MATSLATKAASLEYALDCDDPALDAIAGPDPQDDLAADPDEIDLWPRGAIGGRRGARYALTGEDFEQQDARYESASRIALSLVR